MDLTFNQLTLPCRELEPTVHFYKVLGFRQIVSAPDYARFECAAGNTFSLHVTRVPADRQDQAVIYFETADLDATVSSLMARGVKFDSHPQDQAWLWREARLRDPAGNSICLYHAGENRRYPPWRIG